MNCRCDSFHPPINEENAYAISYETLLALREYFFKRAGYISHEFDPLVHEFVTKMDKWIRTYKDNND